MTLSKDDRTELLDRIGAISSFLRQRGYGVTGFVGDSPENRTYWWSKTFRSNGKPVLELSTERILSAHALELLDIADEALTADGRAH